MNALNKLKQEFHGCTQCPLHKLGRKQVVFGHGDEKARLMFIGEGPGRDEDREGKPFVGRAGKLLEKIIEAMGLQRSEVYISNVVKCRPPFNRTPQPKEGELCMKLILKKEIEFIKPEIICALGATAMRALLGDNMLISRARGNFYSYGSSFVLPTYHPAYLLRNPSAKINVWHDMLKICKKLNLTPLSK